MTHPVEPDSPPEPPPAQPKAKAPWLLVLATLGGLAVGAITVGGAWLANGSARDVDTQAVTMPDRIGEYVPVDQVELTKNGPGAQLAARFRNQHERSSERLSQSHGGAGAAMRVYATQRLEHQFTVLVYRERAPHPRYVPYVNPADLGLVKAPRSLEEFGEVSCEVANQPTPQGRTPEPGSAQVAVCVRTSNSLTVEINPTGGDNSGPQQVVALVNEVWDAVS